MQILLVKHNMQKIDIISLYVHHTGLCHFGSLLLGCNKCYKALMFGCFILILWSVKNLIKTCQHNQKLILQPSLGSNFLLGMLRTELKLQPTSCPCLLVLSPFRKPEYSPVLWNMQCKTHLYPIGHQFLARVLSTRRRRLYYCCNSLSKSLAHQNKRHVERHSGNSFSPSKFS